MHHDEKMAIFIHPLFPFILTSDTVTLSEVRLYPNYTTSTRIQLLYFGLFL